MVVKSWPNGCKNANCNDKKCHKSIDLLAKKANKINIKYGQNQR